MNILACKHTQGTKSLKVLSVEDGLNLLNDIPTKEYFDVDGRPVKLSPKLNVFRKKGIKCSICGAKGTYFVLEIGKNNHRYYYTLNLYATKPAGRNTYHEVLMNVDHIRPRSKGGKSGLYNLQTTCASCNTKKANHYEN